jgi:hypothetical protein
MWKLFKSKDKTEKFPLIQPEDLPVAIRSLSPKYSNYAVMATSGYIAKNGEVINFPAACLKDQSQSYIGYGISIEEAYSDLLSKVKSALKAAELVAQSQLKVEEDKQKFKKNHPKLLIREDL